MSDTLFPSDLTRFWKALHTQVQRGEAEPHQYIAAIAMAGYRHFTAAFKRRGTVRTPVLRAESLPAQELFGERLVTLPEFMAALSAHLEGTETLRTYLYRATDTGTFEKVGTFFSDKLAHERITALGEEVGVENALAYTVAWTMPDTLTAIDVLNAERQIKDYAEGKAQEVIGLLREALAPDQADGGPVVGANAGRATDILFSMN